jgi:hypothetical protein
MSIHIKPLPPVHILRQMFEPDFEKGILYAKTRGAKAKHKEGEDASFLVKHKQQHTRKAVYVGGSTYMASRVLWAMHTGRDPRSLYIDHIDRNTLNDAISNLRAVSPGENNMNRVASSSTGHRGVYFTRPLKDGTPRYVVQLCRSQGRKADGTFARKTYTFGYFCDLKDAIARAEEVFQEWGMTEFMPGGVRPLDLAV